MSGKWSGRGNKKLGAEKTVDPAAAIAAAALEKRDAFVSKPCRYSPAYGAEAGNLALKLLPYAVLRCRWHPKNSAANSRGKFLEALLIKVA